MKEQFSGIGENAVSHFNNFVDLCDMQKYNEVDGDCRGGITADA